jgi:hypothetical protein
MMFGAERRRFRRRLHQLDEMAIGILHDDARSAAEGHVNRRPPVVT